ncbi:hypothetical protein ABEB36_015220 [Hypothenemus hampei]|uniref:Uncharacterized protein n=1 Tax=Hypothenemus hampei TaxID=57062 RepID=A0ABD1E1M7_HYPHA
MLDFVLDGSTPRKSIQQQNEFGHDDTGYHLESEGNSMAEIREHVSDHEYSGIASSEENQVHKEKQLTQ